MAYLSKSNVALTVFLTFGTTLLSPVLTPVLIYLFLHQHVDIAFLPMVTHIAGIVMIPIAGGLILNYWIPTYLDKVKSFFPALSILMIAIIIACIFALNRAFILSFPKVIVLAVLSLNVLGFVFGRKVAQLFKYDEDSILAVIFDYGMFDAIVAIMICTTFFDKETALPAVIISVIQNLTAPVIVRYAKNKRNILVCD